MAEILDSYSEANYSAVQNLQNCHPSDSAATSAMGQAFTCPKTAILTSCKFYLDKQGSPTGNATAALYLATGTVGTDAKPTGSALATSGNLDVTTIATGPDRQLFEFTFSTPYTMQSGIDYCIVYQNPASGTIDGSNYVRVGTDTDSPTHSGNMTYYTSSGWLVNAAIDTCFYIYGDPISGGGPIIFGGGVAIG